MVFGTRRAVLCNFFVIVFSPILFAPDETASLFLELGFASFLIEKIRESPNNEIIASHLFTISDLVDVDESGAPYLLLAIQFLFHYFF